ncbi:MAG TPA: lectin-like protein, partial [Urbifossiella sp.]|nr:lectin-like protein [Urbifossiella sp.]
MPKPNFLRRLMTRSLRPNKVAPLRRFEQLEDRTVPTQLAYSLFDTATDNTGAILNSGTATHYTITASPTGPSAAVITNVNSNRGYISQTTSGSSPAGEYDYTTSFNLPAGTTMTGATLTGLISADDSVIGFKLDSGATIPASFTGIASGGMPFSVDISGLSAGAIHSITFMTNNAVAGTQTEFRAANLVLNVLPPASSTPPILTGSGTPITLGVGGPAVAVDPGLTINNPSGANFTGASVIIGANFASGDQLQFTNAGSVVGTYNPANGVLSFTGTDTAANYQAALRSVKISTTAVGGGPRNVSFSIAPGSFNAANNRFYVFVQSGSINWGAAEAQASGMSIFGLQGYLAVITSAAENAFAFSKVGAQAAWLGMSDGGTEGFWQYETGPLAGAQFSSGSVSVGGHYTNWNGGEPNNAGGEDFAQFLSSGQWNDLNETNASPQGYVVEFGGSPNDPSLQLTSATTVNILNIGSVSPSSTTIDSPDTPITLTGTGFVSGATVFFNGTALATNFVSGTSLTATIPAAFLTAAGTDPIIIKNPDGTTSGAFTFTVSGGLTATLAGGNLTIADSAGVNNAITVVKDNAGNFIVTDSLQVFLAVPAGATLSNGNHTFTLASSSVTGSLIFNTAAGTDSLTVDYTGTGGFYSTPINYNGGNNAGDKLVVKSGAINKVTETYIAPSGQGHAGTIVYDTDGTGTTTDTISYTGVAPVDLTPSGPVANLIFTLPTGGSNASLEDDGSLGNNISQIRSVSGTPFETSTFQNPTNSLTINRGSAADTLVVAATPDLKSNVTIGSVGAEFASINFTGALTLNSGNSLAANATGAISFSTANSDLATSGAGAIALTTATNISLVSGSSISTVNGAITLNANQQATPTAGSFIGIGVSGV